MEPSVIKHGLAAALVVAIKLHSLAIVVLAIVVLAIAPCGRTHAGNVGRLGGALDAVVLDVHHRELGRLPRVERALDARAERLELGQLVVVNLILRRSLLSAVLAQLRW